MAIVPIRPITTPADESAVPAVQATGEAIRPDLRNVVAAEFTALVSRETNRLNNEWRTTMEGVRGALTALERAVGQAGGKLESPIPASAVSDLVEVIVAATRRDTDAAIRQVRADADLQAARFVDLVGRLKGELQAERDQLKATREAISKERALRALAETACREAEKERAKMGAQLTADSEAAQAELEAWRVLVGQLRRQIEMEKSERERLLAVLKTVQRALSSTEAIDSAKTSATGSLVSALELDSRESSGHPDRVTMPVTPAPAKIQAVPNAVANETRATGPANVQPPPETFWNPTLVAATERLFDEIERKYQRDVQANLNPADLLDRLLINLQIGHAELRRSCGADGEANGLFERHMTMLLDSKAATSFGRHLSIAACHWGTPDDRKTMNG
jgi:hypothetical protein